MKEFGRSAQRLRRFVCAALIASAYCSLSRAARADAGEFRPDMSTPSTPPALLLPIEGALGDTWRRLKLGPAATSEFTFLPGIRLDRFELNGVLRGLYLNPYFDFALGGRAGVRVAEILDGLVPIHLGVDVTYLTVHPGVRAAGGLQAGLGTLVRLGLWFGHDSESDRWFGSLALLTDLTKWSDPIGALLELTPTENRARE